jgi:hypothetical protein
MKQFERQCIRLAAILVLLPVGANGYAAEAHMYRCKDANGRVYYADRPHTSCQGGQTDEMTKQGLVLDRRTEFEHETVEEREQRLAQQRRDRALLQTYGSESQIEQAKERSLQTPLLGMKYSRKKLAIYNERLDELRNREAALSAAGESAPLSLIEDIEQTLTSISQVEAEMEKKQRLIDRTIDRYEAEKERYRILTGTGSL